VSLDSQALTRELLFLRKNAATRHPRLLSRLGPQVRALCGITERDNIALARRKIAARFRELPKGQKLGDQEDDLCLAVEAAYALHPEADHRLLEDRTRWLAQGLRCDERTARRRIDDVVAVLVDAAAEAGDRLDGHVAASSDGWYVQTFRAIMRLDTPTPELTEQRTIAVTQDGVKKIECRFSLPRAGTDPSASHDVHAEVLDGVRIVGCERTGDEHFCFTLELPESLMIGDTHDYSLLFRLPEGQPMRPHYVFQPLRHCERFELTVRFDPKRVPRRIWLLDEAPPRAIDSAQPGCEALLVGPSGEVSLTFPRLRQGFGYGVRWSQPVHQHA
jgi:hypothetical protein